tara:strand:+ start:702 stop:815 length:114 start_codon:yes stop_codon:yes gene_type:complete
MRHLSAYGVIECAGNAMLEGKCIGFRQVFDMHAGIKV